MTTRLSRYNSLRIKGLFAKEAQEYSKNEYADVPYFVNELLPVRQSILRQWKKWKKDNNIPEGRGRKMYVDMVKVWYESHNWLKSNGQIDPWKAWRDYEKRWKDKNPDYPKPSYRRHKDIMLSEKKLRKSLGY